MTNKPALYEKPALYAKPPVLRGQRIQLRALAQRDLPAFTAYRCHPDVARYQSWTDYDAVRAQQLLDNQQNSDFGAPDSWFQLAICDTNDALIGDLALHFLDNNQLEIGFTLAPAHQGKGYAAEAVRCLLSWFFEEDGNSSYENSSVEKPKGHRVSATCDTENHASYQLLERLGFRREAHFVENIFFKGAWGSEYQYALLRREWQAMQGGS
ncbi:GNAT family N-acetyltransferase [Shewanella sp. JM162201]|uniref:GNAT family N-acetyltransferase n=1 Tax=Shewanella jiangmenensis TaxID=2837387 RepID=A0ABS5V195_9GAMM|nr:GNAT family protein [Shewanella jiangmenensis]MBT1443693.1 GNAT family N-acetyltransferase [Shewanella jiangmenensis]